MMRASLMPPIADAFDITSSCSHKAYRHWSKSTHGSASWLRLVRAFHRICFMITEEIAVFISFLSPLRHFLILKVPAITFSSFH